MMQFSNAGCPLSSLGRSSDFPKRYDILCSRAKFSQEKKSNARSRYAKPRGMYNFENRISPRRRRSVRICSLWRQDIEWRFDIEYPRNGGMRAFSSRFNSAYEEFITRIDKKKYHRIYSNRRSTTRDVLLLYYVRYMRMLCKDKDNSIYRALFC